MEEKDFFKLSWLKAAIFLIILLSVFPSVKYDTGIRCITIPCPSESIGTFLNYFFNSPNHYIYSIDYVSLALGFIASYLISCSFAFLINKLLKEKI